MATGSRKRTKINYFWKRLLGWQNGDIVKVWCGLGYIANSQIGIASDPEYLVHFLYPFYCSKVFTDQEIIIPNAWERRVALNEAKKQGITGLR